MNENFKILKEIKSNEFQPTSEGKSKYNENK